MKKLHKSVLSIFLLLSISCTKDLSLEPHSSITAASFWKTEADAKAGVNAMYIPFRSQATLNTFLLGEARSDALTFGLAGTSGYNLYYENILTPSSAGPGWSGYYSIINSANLVLKYVPGVAMPVGEKNRMLAEAYTMRAYTYFVMVRTWGKLVLRTEPLEEYDPANIQKERTPVNEVFAFIKEDLEKALALFPDNNFSTGRAKWSKPAANALKADVYLWTGKRLNGGSADFTTALSALNEVETADVSLLSNFADVFAYGNKGNKEVIMAVRQFVGESSAGYTNLMYGQPVPACSPAAVKTMVGTQGSGTNHSWQLTPAVRNAFNNDDQRKNSTFVDLFTYNSSCQQTGYYATLTMKYKGTVVSGVRNFADDIIVYRYADILLMKAEAKNALNQDPSIEMNKVRQRAYGNKFSSYVFVNGTKAQNDDAILRERLLELVIEGKRWWDLVRFGKAFELVPSLKSRSGQDYLLLFPISSSALALEPNIQQNPGYN